MQIELIETNKLIPYINNPRKNQNIDKVAGSIKEFGFQQPIVVDKEMVIIVGHTRFEASKKLKIKKVPVVIADLPKTKAKAYRIADNRLNEDSDWDLTLLNLEFKELMNGNYDLESLGFDSREMKNLLDEEPSEFKDLADTQEEYFKSIIFAFDDLEVFNETNKKIEEYREKNNLNTKEEALVNLLK